MLITLYYNAILLLLHSFNDFFQDNLAPERQTILDFTAARDDGWHWHQLDHMQVICTSQQTITRPLPQHYYTIFKNIPPLACYSFDTREWILTFFGINVTDKASNQKALSYATSSNSCFCTTWQKGKHENRMFTQMLY